MLKPKHLESGDTVGVVAPAFSLSIVHDRWIALAESFFAERGLNVVFSPHCRENWQGNGGTIEQRVADLMGMFTDERIQAIITAIGGYNSNQLLEHLDYDRIRANPKILVGYSDITALTTAIHVKTGLVTFSGPHFSTLGQPHPFDYTIRCFDTVLGDAEAQPDIIPSRSYAEDDWYLHADAPQPRQLRDNPGWTVVREGTAEGELVGGNLTTLLRLMGTEYSPKTQGKILFIEEAGITPAPMIDSAVTQLRQAGALDGVRGLLVGRFHFESDMDDQRAAELLHRATRGIDIPVITGLDFGHTDPLMTIPIGVPCLMDAYRKRIRYMESGVI